MCGIVGIIGNENAISITFDGLKKLEYRGYDSAGIAVINKKEFVTFKEEGKINRLGELLENNQIKSKIAIGHTRWATHGSPSKINAHPHSSSKICLVHNGIIENHQEIKDYLLLNGAKFLSETDSEVLPYLIEDFLKKTNDIRLALIEATKKIKGTYAIALMLKEDPNSIIVAKNCSPLTIGIGLKEHYVASDYFALAEYTDKIVILEDGDYALITDKSFEVFNQNNVAVKRPVKIMSANKSKISKEGFAHFMLKEIYEQPRVMEETIQTYIDISNKSINLPNFDFNPKEINKITIIGCGTSYYAALCGKYLIEEITKIEVEVDIASEFRYRSYIFRPDNLMIFISQSGETADTLASLKYALKNKQKTLSIVNVAHSSMAQLSDSVIRTLAGPEIGVASTKAYTAQIAVLSLFAIHLADLRGKISPSKKSKLINQFLESGVKMNNLLATNKIKNIKEIAKSISKSKNILFIGRSISYITALEAALKLKEISYINAFGIAAGELKHGTIALIDSKMPVIVIAPFNDEIFEKTLSNAFEVSARGGKIICVSDKMGISRFKKISKKHIETMAIDGLIEESLLLVIPMQLLAYYVALAKGANIDQPRNLAKSVTVE